MTSTEINDFLVNELHPLLNKLSPDTEGRFGLMTAQHMVEHIAGSIKGAANKHEGERDSPATERQLAFQNFIKGGSVLKHRPSEKTKADLPPLEQDSFEKAIALVPKAVKEYYDFKKINKDYVPYAYFMGELPYEEFEFFHYMHIRYHLWQFGLIEQYP